MSAIFHIFTPGILIFTNFFLYQMNYIDYLLTAILPITILFILFYGNKKDNEGNFFFSKDYTTVLKGICCLFIVIGHTPDEYKNMLQDMLSSFGYVRVTLFFMMTGYGLSLCASQKTDYMKHFWRNRLSSLLIPGFLVNLTVFFTHKQIEGYYNFKDIIFIDPYISVLLQYYIFFFIVQHGKKYYGEKNGNIILVLGVILSSLLEYLLKEEFRAWPYERIGLAWGILLYYFFNDIKSMITPKLWRIILYTFLCIVLGILYIKFKHIYFWCEYLLKIILGAIIITLLFTLSSTRIWGNKILSFLGDIYYEVFLSHLLMIEIIKNIFPNSSSGIFILLVAISTIVFSAIIHYAGLPIIKICRTKK